MLLRKIWDNLEEYILVSSLMFTVSIIFLQIIMRYIFSNSLSWSEELARYIFLWQIWLGASFAVKEHRHLRIEALRSVLPKKMQNYFEIITLFIWFGFSIFLAYKGTEITMMLFNRGQLSPAMRLPMYYAYASVPVGCGLMAIRLIEEMVKLFKLAQKGEVL